LRRRRANGPFAAQEQTTTQPEPVLFAVTDLAAHAALLTADFPAALARFLRTHKRKFAFPG
jgi:hypothetical protein